MESQSFFQEVLQVARLIPRGRVTSYGAIASFLGTTSSARMVGWALNQSMNDRTVPAHRVVNRMGVLTGKIHFHPPERMQQLLADEGVEVRNDQIIDFEKVFWDPLKELSL